MKRKLTKKQKLLVNELNEIYELFGINYHNVQDVEKEARTPYLESIKDQLIRSEIVTSYTLIDEHLNMILSDYFFGKEKSYIKLWKTKKFQNFNYFILERLFLLNKLDLTIQIIKMPTSVETIIRKINDLRNGLAHSFFPQNLKRNKPIYKGEDIYTLKGLRVYSEDMGKVNDFFIQRLIRIRKV